MHASGNDFMIVNAVYHRFRLTPEQLKKLSHRHTGVGFDQLLLLQPPVESSDDFYYQTFNSDGSEAAQCGNGVRCLSHYIWKHNLTQKNLLKLRTISGYIIANREDNQHPFSVNMGTAELRSQQIPTNFNGDQCVQQTPHNWQKDLHLPKECYTVSMGNPHLVFFMSPEQSPNIVRCAKQIQANTQVFPEGVNISFVEWSDDNSCFVRVFERGVGETMCCGTANCAVTVAAFISGKISADSPVKITTYHQNNPPSIAQCSEDLQVTLRGHSAFVYEGTLSLAILE